MVWIFSESIEAQAITSSLQQVHLCNEKLKISLLDLLNKYASDADKLTNLGSSQANESLNNAISSKAPKFVFYAGSESNEYRVAAAIAQKNMG